MPFLDPTLAPSSRQEAFRLRNSLNRLERAGPFNPPGNADFAPDHDIS